MPSFRETAVDDPVARRLLAEYFAMRADTFPPELGAYAPSFPATADFEPPNGVFLVVLSDDGSGGKEDGRAEVGCGGVRRLTPARFEIKHLWIRPAARGKGFGRLLLRELERRAREFGATEVVLDTNASLTAAGSLYRSSGYAAIPPYNENPNATHWFAKRVG